MKSPQLPEKLLVTKKDIYTCLGYQSMKPIYDKIFDDETVKELGFESIEQFKKVKTFSLKQSNVLKDYLCDLVLNNIGKQYYNKEKKITNDGLK